MPLRAVGRGLRRLVLPLVGFWDLVRRLEEVRAQVASMQPRLDSAEARFAAEAEWARQRHELAQQRHEASLGRFDDLTRQLAQMAAERSRRAGGMAAEDARLFARDGPFAAVVAAEIDRLDGYLVHHAATLHDSVEALRAELAAAARAPGRREALAYAAPELDALVVTSDFDLVVPTAEQAVLLYILRHGLHAVEPGVRALLHRRLAPGAVVVDAGANVGIHSLTLAAIVGPEGQVHCFEPLPHLAAALKRTLRLNGFAARARVEQAALAEQEGEATFHRAADGPYSSLYALPEETTVAEEVQVRVTTLDTSLPPGSRVDFVKIDVEGAEPRVWRGMQRVVADNPAIEVVLEWSASHFRRSGEDPDAFLAAIREAGFHAFAIEDGEAPGRLAPVENPAGLEAANVLLTRRPVAPEELAAR